MKKFFKLLGGLIVLLVILAAALPYLVSLDSFKPRIIATVQEKMGKHLRINGHIHASLFPAVGLRIDDAALFSSKEEEDKKSSPLVALKSFDVKIGLSKLIFSGDVEIMALTLVEPSISLHVDKSGQANWSDNVSKPESAAMTQQEKKEEPTTKAPSTPFSLTLNNISISGGTLNYTDDSNGQSWKLEKLNFKGNMDSASSPLSLKGDATLNQEAITFKANLDSLDSMFKQGYYKLDIDLASSIANFGFSGAHTGTALKGHLNIDSPSLKKLAAWAQPKAKAIDVATPLSFRLSADAEITPAFTNLSDTSLTLDGNILNGKIGFQPAQSMRPIQINADLSTDGLDIKQYQPKADNSSFIISDAQAETSPKWDTTPIDYSALKLFEGFVRLRFGAIQTSQMHLDKGAMEVTLNLGQLKFDLIDTQMYSGVGNISVQLDAGNKAFSSRMVFKDIDSEGLLKEVAQNDSLKGKGTFQLALQGNGASVSQIIPTLQGNGKLTMQNGAIKGYNLPDMLRHLTSALSLVKTPGQETDFSELSGSFVIKDGVLTNDDLNMKTQLLRLSGKGSVNLPPRTLSYHFIPQFISSQNGKDVEGVAVPFIISGSMDSPRLEPDVKGAVQDILSDPSKAKEKLKNTKDMLKKSGVGDSLKNLKGLFKQPKN